jgi:hypothetical protein
MPLVVLVIAGTPLHAALPPLPEPLRLPPGLIQVLPISRAGSYMADAVRVQDCPADEDNPFGTCSSSLFGGYAIWSTQLTGFVEIRFYPPINGISHFEVSHPGNLIGDDTKIKAPQFYEMPVLENRVLDAFEAISSGDLNLNTGEITNLEYVIFISNSWYVELGAVNPNLKPPAFRFPGIYGSAHASFEQREDGLLDFTFKGSSFLPLGNNVLGDPVRIPLPLCGPFLNCAGIEAPGTSLHPQIRVSTKAPEEASCQPDCFIPQPNSIQEYTANSYYTSFGDVFTVNIPQLGGPAEGRTHLQGRLMIQFGEPNKDGNIPFALSTLPPGGLAAPIPDAPAPLSVFKITMLGHNERLFFPNFTYVTADPVLLEDGFDPSIGLLNPNTGAVIGDLLYRGVPAQSLFSTIINLNITRIPLDTFRHVGPARFSLGPNGENVFHYDGELPLTFDTFAFPSPNYDNPNEAFTSGPGSLLNPYMRFQGMQITDEPQSVRSGSAQNVISSFSEVFSYSYAVSCDPSVNSNAVFEYTNQTNGGTFRMESLSWVSCINSVKSERSPGDYDVISFTGYGAWSEDSDRHTANVQISVTPGEEYVSIQIDGGLISGVHTKPIVAPIP